MRRLLSLFTIFSALLCLCPAAAYAYESGVSPQSSRVNITVVMPDVPETENPDVGEAAAESEENSETGKGMKESASEVPQTPKPLQIPVPLLYPVSVEEVNESGGRSIVKVYELSPSENPAHISREPFERGGWNYELSDIVKAETAFADSKEHTETITLNTDTKDTAAILSKLEPTIAYESEDGFVGILELNVASVKVEQAGTKTNNYTMTETREYPQLSAPDTSLVPKTISSGGTTYKLANVDWRSGNNAAIDYESLPEYYTAVASYTAMGSKTVVTGYVTTAEYSGSVGKISEGKTVYTAYFLGTEIIPQKTPLEFVPELPSSVTGTATNENEPIETPSEPETQNSENETAASAVEVSDDIVAAEDKLPGKVQTDSNVSLIISVALIALITGVAAGYVISRKNTAKKKGGATHEKTD